mgnify:CR=1 FL=1
MKKQSSIEWLVKEIAENHISSVDEILEQAKQMHKQEIIDASEIGNDWDNAMVIDGDEYYKNTYEKEN